VIRVEVELALKPRLARSSHVLPVQSQPVRSRA
jgi:hypothetical protein